MSYEHDARQMFQVINNVDPFQSLGVRPSPSAEDIMFLFLSSGNDYLPVW